MPDPMHILNDTEQPEGRRIEAAKALGQAGDASVIDKMLFVLESAETPLARAIVAAVKALGGVKTLGARLSDPEPKTRADAARKLSKLQDPQSALALVKAAQDPEPPVRRAAVHALSYVAQEPAALDRLLASLRDADPETRAYAASGLGRSADVRAARALTAAKESEKDDIVRDFIEAALRKRGKGTPAT